MNRRFLKTCAAVLCGALVVAPAACTPGSLGGGGSDAELVFWCNNGYLADFEVRLAEFTKETGIPVRVEGIQANRWGELVQQLSTSAYSGSLPDCGDIATEAMASLVAADLLEPIDSYLARDEEELRDVIADMEPVLYNAHKYDGKMYSLPTTWNNMCLYYNKNVLAAAGVTPDDPNYPHDGWSIENFLYCCDKITAKNVVSGTGNKYGYKIQNQYFLTIEPWLNAYGTSVLTEDWKDTNLDGQAAKDCFSMLHGMLNNEDVTKQYSPKFGGTAEYDLFYSNRLGFMANGLPYVYNLYTGGFNNSAGNVSKLKEGYDVVSFPSVDGKVHTTIGVGACPIFKTSEHKEEAWKLAKFLSGKKFQTEFMTENLWAIPVLNSAIDILVQKGFFPENGKLFAESLQNATMVPAPTAYSAVELEVRRWFGGYMANTDGFTLTGSGNNSLETLAKTIRGFLGA